MTQHWGRASRLASDGTNTEAVPNRNSFSNFKPIIPDKASAGSGPCELYGCCNKFVKASSAAKAIYTVSEFARIPRTQHRKAKEYENLYVTIKLSYFACSSQNPSCLGCGSQ
jgi:hypothetical protein